MSATRFRVGDKVRVREGLIVDKYYSDVRCDSSMAKMGGRVLTIKGVYGGYYAVEEHVFCWSDEMLEPAEKTLDNLCAGDDISKGFGVRKVLAAVDGCYLLSNTDEYTIANDWYTAAELKEIGYQVLSPGHSITLIEIDGKKYKKDDVEKAIKDLEPIE